MDKEIMEKFGELFNDLLESKTSKKKEVVEKFMNYTGEKNKITAETIMSDSEDWLLINLRKYLVNQGIKIYCVQMKCTDGHTAMHHKFVSTLDEAIRIAEQVQSDDEAERFSEVQADLLFKV